MATATDRPSDRPSRGLERQDRPFSALTLAELEEKAARLTRQAAEMRVRQRGMLATHPSTLALGRSLADVSKRADDYAALVRMAQERGVEQ